MRTIFAEYKTTPGSDCALNALAIDKPLEYARLYLDGNLQMWVDAGNITMESKPRQYSTPTVTLPRNL